MFLPHTPSTLPSRSSRQSVCLSYMDAPMIWFRRRCLDNTACSFFTLLISLCYQQEKIMWVQPLHHSLFLLWPFSLFPILSLTVSVSVYVSLSLSVSFSFCLSLSHSLSPHRVCSGRLTLTCIPVHPPICCSDQLSSRLKPGRDTLRLRTEKMKRQTISSRLKKSTYKPKNAKIKCPP